MKYANVYHSLGSVPVLRALFTLVARIAESVLLLPMRQRIGLGHIIDVRGGSHHAVRLYRLGIGTDVRFVPKDEVTTGDSDPAQDDNAAGVDAKHIDQERQG